MLPQWSRGQMVMLKVPSMKQEEKLFQQNLFPWNKLQVHMEQNASTHDNLQAFLSSRDKFFQSPFSFSLSLRTSGVDSLKRIAGQGNSHRSMYEATPLIPKPTISRFPGTKQTTCHVQVSSGCGMTPRCGRSFQEQGAKKVN